MTSEQVIFILVSLVTLGSGFVVVTNRNLFHAALAMMVSFFGVAGVYVTLEAGFLAAAQLLVYIGAISILVIFAIMLTRRLMKMEEPSFNSQPVLGAVTAVVSFAVIVLVLVRMDDLWPLQASEAPLASRPAVDDSVILDSVAALGRSFVSPDAYVIPFELASVLLLAALVGAILIAWPKEDGT